MQAMKVAVVGGGLGGLTAAALLARGGCEVTVYERAKDLGGRARTSGVDGFCFNLGPHALYLAGAAARVLGHLGIRPRGGIPGQRGHSYALRAGQLHTLPRGPVSLMTTDVVGLPGKLELAKLLASLRRLDADALATTSTRDWLGARLSRDDARDVFGSLVRVGTYCADLDALSAQVAVSQLQLALEGNVLYLDGGWRMLVEAVEAAARAAGARVVTSARVEGLVLRDGVVEGLRVADAVHAVDAVVVAGSPADVAALVPEDGHLARDAAEATPVKAATLELGLSRLPRPDAVFALGSDRPWYASVHSAAARLGPEGGAMVHVMKYLGPREPDVSEAELEAVMDTLQPGWREHLVARRYRPGLVVNHLLPRADAGGYGGRPPSQVPHLRGLFRVGDWVGPEGLLADASFASAEAVARVLAPEQRDMPRRAVGA
ncbi:FAD-dependent oxidoreductase [Myxococcus sp. K15C18031901]|uniref:FAD-dependent oxidoreductase n=1 Tax=Myxococcus dinghuensis TaxID=2906761 RepID=UPI0020A80E47|nr:FAD-dependent oxidoreductase [Myxococcus dinghuensis]MCP3099219.1 FAD-dependent oxidoreductase [Myxococcus dinghuensis]